MQRQLYTYHAKESTVFLLSLSEDHVNLLIFLQCTFDSLCEYERGKYTVGCNVAFDKAIDKAN